MTSFTKLFGLIGLMATLGAAQMDPWWVVSHGKMVATRLDPVLSPGAVSTHTHNIIGSSSFAPTYTYENSQEGTCVTGNVAIDKSNYWVPYLYNKWNNGSFTLAEFSYANTYYQVRRDDSIDEPVEEFPPGFRMMAGSASRNTFNASSYADQAVSFVCLGVSGPQTNTFPTTYCPDGLRAQVYFPHCWDGVNNWLEGSAHVSYATTGNYDGGGPCPASHPKRIIGLFFEFIFDDSGFNAGAERVLATGDDLGYSFHGDFTNGWPEGFFQEVFSYGSTCGVGFALQDCPPLQKVMKQSGNDCSYNGTIVDENVGYTPLTKLPGDNPIWGKEGPKGSTPGYKETAQFVQASDGMPDSGGAIIPQTGTGAPTQIDAGNIHIDTIGGDTIKYTGPTLIPGDGKTDGGAAPAGPTTSAAVTVPATNATSATSDLASMTSTSGSIASASASSSSSTGLGGDLLGQPTSTSSTSASSSTPTGPSDDGSGGDDGDDGDTGSCGTSSGSTKKKRSRKERSHQPVRRISKSHKRRMD